MSRPTPTVRALLRGVVDYAGMFPPANLSMSGAVERYAAHRASEHAWMLGRFVVELSNIDELAECAATAGGWIAEPWQLSALIGGDWIDAAARLTAFNAAHRGRLVIDVVECRAMSVDAIGPAAVVFPRDVTVYVEVALASAPRSLVSAVAASGARVKLRTGGVTAAAFPSAVQLSEFMSCCAEMNVPFKATAGLHHPLRGEFPLTYDDSSPRGTMFGFLNVFCGAVFARAGIDVATLAELLSERDARAFAFGESELQWREFSATLDQITEARRHGGVSFGSCSFEEPVAELKAMELV